MSANAGPNPNQGGPPSTFTQQETVDAPGIIGARWWQQSIATPIPRRSAMTGFVVLGGVLAAMATLGTCAVIAGSSSSGDGDVEFKPKSALDMQKEYGWNFGATGDKLVFDGQSTKPFDKAALATLADDLAPTDARYKPYFIPTLFQSPTALRKTVPSGDPDATAFAPLKDALVPIFTSAMERAFAQGQALASLLGDPKAKDLAVVIDLEGPEAVAFAAGMANACDPVFLLDNWPHPRGVVPSHLTVAAAAYYQPLFANAKSTRPKTARPMFVLDRKRLAPYSDDATQFDNRYTARMPSAANLAALGTKNILLVVPHSFEMKEQDDLVDDFLAFQASTIAIHIVSLFAFMNGASPAKPLPVPGVPGATYSGPYFYGGSPDNHLKFWTHWSAPKETLVGDDVKPYVPTARKTEFSAGAASAASSPTGRPRPTNFGMVPVAVAVGTGVVLGAKLSRNGSWNRTSSSSSGS